MSIEEDMLDPLISGNQVSGRCMNPASRLRNEIVSCSIEYLALINSW